MCTGGPGLKIDRIRARRNSCLASKLPSNSAILPFPGAIFGTIEGPVEDLIGSRLSSETPVTSVPLASRMNRNNDIILPCLSRTDDDPFLHRVCRSKGLPKSYKKKFIVEVIDNKPYKPYKPNIAAGCSWGCSLWERRDDGEYSQDIHFLTVATFGSAQFPAVRPTNCCKETKDKDVWSGVPIVSLGACLPGCCNC